MILTYHKIHPESKSIWWITPDAFYRQMADLRSKKVVYLNDYDPTDENQVVITFDGVYKDILKYAVPILQYYRYPFELFIIGGTIGKDNAFDIQEPLTEFADFETLSRMVAAGGRLQWHSWSHARLAGTEDLAVFEKELSVPSELHALDPDGFQWYAYPHGERDQTYRSQVASRFVGALACDDGNDSDRYDLNRQTVFEETRFIKTTVSLIIPCYNYGHLVAEAIESALLQIVPPDEILFIDDASSDNSVEVARRYEPRIRVIANEKNLGVVENFRKAVSLTHGDYIVFLGADNRFRSDYVEESKTILDANPDVGVVYTHFAMFGDRAAVEAARMGAIAHPRVPGVYIYHFPVNPAKSIHEENYIHGSSMYRRIAYDQAGGYVREDKPEDHSLFARMLDLGWKARLWDSTSLEYRQHSNDQINHLKIYELENTYLRKELTSLRTDKAALHNDLQHVVEKLMEKEMELSHIKRSRAWRLASIISNRYSAWFPAGSWRARIVSGTLSVLSSILNISRTMRLRKEETLLSSSDLFDQTWYVLKNPDLRFSDLTPIRHYLLFGGFEGRDPSPVFSSLKYLNAYEDVKQAGINPLVHYLKTGRNEGRISYPVDLD